MFGLSRSVTLALVGWLWADILLGLFVIFLAAASPPVKLNAPSGPSLDPKPIELTEVPIDAARLLGTDTAARSAEQTRFADDVKRRLVEKAETRRIAIVFAYGWSEDPAVGQELARLATQALTTGSFQGAVMKDLHFIKPPGAGAKIDLEIYVYR